MACDDGNPDEADEMSAAGMASAGATTTWSPTSTTGVGTGTGTWDSTTAGTADATGEGTTTWGPEGPDLLGELPACAQFIEPFVQVDPAVLEAQFLGSWAYVEGAQSHHHAVFAADHHYFAADSPPDQPPGDWSIQAGIALVRERILPGTAVGLRHPEKLVTLAFNPAWSHTNMFGLFCGTEVFIREGAGQGFAGTWRSVWAELVVHHETLDGSARFASVIVDRSVLHISGDSFVETGTNCEVRADSPEQYLHDREIRGQVEVDGHTLLLQPDEARKSDAARAHLLDPQTLVIHDPRGTQTPGTLAPYCRREAAG